MLKLFYAPAQIATVNTNGTNCKKGSQMADIGLLEGFSIITENSCIKDIVKTSNVSKSDYSYVVDLTGKFLMPGLVDCHTHLLFAGSRANEFILKLKGATYEDIAKAGGGIISTVKSIKETSTENLTSLAKQRIAKHIKQGFTTIEIKSGYGLDFPIEIKMLEIIKSLKEECNINIVSTFLGAHTFPLEFKGKHQEYIDIIINKMLPYIAQNNLADFCDAFCEKTAFSPVEVMQIFEKAAEFGIPTKLHTDQFNSIGGIDTAISCQSQSVDHLEVLDKGGIEKLSATDIITVVLPGVSFFLNYGYAPARELINNNCTVAIATDYNPGSNHINNISLIMGLAAIKMKLQPEEILSAFTINAAKALNKHDKCGSIEIGKNADFAVFDTDNYNEIFYNMAENLNIMTVRNSEIIYKG